MILYEFHNLQCFLYPVNHHVIVDGFLLYKVWGHLPTSTCANPIFRVILLKKKRSFLPKLILVSMSKSVGYRCKHLFIGLQLCPIDLQSVFLPVPRCFDYNFLCVIFEFPLAWNAFLILSFSVYVYLCWWVLFQQKTWIFFILIHSVCTFWLHSLV